eukprot:gene22692-29846_t
MATTPAISKTVSKTVTDTVVGEHVHTIVGYSLVKGIGDGEPIASERFTVGGHEWGHIGDVDRAGHINIPVAPGAPAEAAHMPGAGAPVLGFPPRLQDRMDGLLPLERRVVAAGVEGPGPGEEVGAGPDADAEYLAHAHAQAQARVAAVAAAAANAAVAAENAERLMRRDTTAQARLAAVAANAAVASDNAECLMRRDATARLAAVAAENAERLMRRDATARLAAVAAENAERLMRRDATARLAAVAAENAERLMRRDATAELAAVAAENAERLMRRDATAQARLAAVAGNAAVAAENAERLMRRDATNEYAALFVALIGEGPNPQGIVSTTEGKVVRAFHRFTLVDQTGQGRDLTKGRTRDAGAVKISCARQDPNARNCHGYRKFVKRSILEDPARGFLLNDTIIINYTIELVVSSGGAMARGPSVNKAELIKVPPPCLGADLASLITSGESSNYCFVVEGEEMKVHKMILEARSPVFCALLNTPMREGQEGRVVIHDIKASVFRVMLHFVYSDQLPEEHEGPLLEVAMAQHLLVAADQYQLVRLRKICERRLCESVDVETVATTLALAEQNHAEELKKVCLDFVSRNLAAVMNADGFRHMTGSCPQLQAEILSTIAANGSNISGAGNPGGERHGHGSSNRVNVRMRETGKGDDGHRVVRMRRD